MLRRLALSLILAGSAAAQAPFVNVSSGPQGAGLGASASHVEVIDESVFAVGNFRGAGLTDLLGLAQWTPDGWEPVGRPSDGQVIYDTDIGSDGAFVIAVELEDADVPAPVVLRRVDGIWEPAVGAFPETALRMAAGPAGRFLVQTFDGTLHLWDGTAWQSLGVPAGFSSRLAFDPAGAPLASGFIAGTGEQGLVRWTGSEWVALVEGSADTAFDFATGPDGTLYAVGDFPSAGTDVSVARWTGTGWQGLGLFDGAERIDVGDDGTVYAATNGSGQVARWTGSDWEVVGTVDNGSIRGLAVTPSGVVVVGTFRSVDGLFAPNAAWLRADGWEALGTSVEGRNSETNNVTEIEVASDGRVALRGGFDGVPGVIAPGRAQFDDGVWSALGDELIFPKDLRYTADGTLYAAAERRVDDTFVDDVYRWDGSVWQETEIELLASESLVALGLDADGALVASTSTFTPSGRVYRYDGSTWQQFGPSLSGVLSSFVNDADGALIARGGFSEIDSVPVNSIVRWTGNEWASIGDPNAEVTPSRSSLALAVSRDGMLYTYKQNLDGIPELIRWNGTAWASIQNGLVGGWAAALAVAPDGDLYAGGNVLETADGALGDLARWDGETWNVIDAQRPFTLDRVNTLAFAPDGALYIGGQFNGLGGVSSPLFIRYDGERIVTTEPTPESPFALRLAPNPSRGRTMLTFDAVGAARVELFDALGRRIAVLRDGPAVGETRIDVPTAALPPGVYLVRLQTADGVETARFTVAR